MRIGNRWQPTAHTLKAHLCSLLTTDKDGGFCLCSVLDLSLFVPFTWNCSTASNHWRQCGQEEDVCLSFFSCHLFNGITDKYFDFLHFCYCFFCCCFVVALEFLWGYRDFWLFPPPVWIHLCQHRGLMEVCWCRHNLKWIDVFSFADGG